MAKWTADDVYISVNGQDISDHVASVDVKESYAAKDSTGMGANATSNVLNKAKTCTIDVEFINNYGATATYATLKNLVGSNTAFTVIARPTSGTASSTNPQATMMSLLPEWDPISGAYGDLGKTAVQFISGNSTGITWTP